MLGTGGQTMIILEVILFFAKKLFYYTLRPIIWIVTARDCRHCKYGRWNTYSCWYCDPFGWHCGIGWIPDEEKCQSTPWRCKFKRRKDNDR